MNKTIVLVGMMGCGKSYIGKKLARALNVNFLDADDEIVKKAGMPITDIFDIQGEAYFRQLEYQTTQEILEGSPIVLAAGGGAFAQDNTRALIKEKGLSIWLKASAETILERLKYDRSRPLLQVPNKAEKLRELMEIREPLYAMADMTVSTDANKIAPVIEDILSQLEDVDTL